MLSYVSGTKYMLVHVCTYALRYVSAIKGHSTAAPAHFITSRQRPILVQYCSIAALILYTNTRYLKQLQLHFKQSVLLSISSQIIHHSETQKVADKGI